MIDGFKASLQKEIDALTDIIAKEVGVDKAPEGPQRDALRIQTYIQRGMWQGFLAAIKEHEYLGDITINDAAKALAIGAGFGLARFSVVSRASIDLGAVAKDSYGYMMVVGAMSELGMSPQQIKDVISREPDVMETYNSISRMPKQDN